MILNALEQQLPNSSSPRKRSQSPVRFQLEPQQTMRKSVILNESEIDRMMMHWEEYKFKGLKISRRSYHASVFHNNALYAYGGYEINAGILSDFQRLEMSPETTIFAWKATPTKGTLKPGPRYRHSAVLYQDKMYIYGGQVNAVENTDKFMAFDFNTQEWSNVEPIKQDPTPALDSHSATLWNKSDGKVSMVIVGGFMGGKNGGYSNAVYEYSFDDNEWRALFKKQDVEEEVTNPVIPQGRMGQGAAIKGDSLYMFGGNEGNNKMNDLWRFDLNEKKWTLIKPEGKTIPEQRNGHSLDCYKDLLILFGGILDVTHEKNDIYIYSISKNTWYNVEKETKWIFEEVPRELMSPTRNPNASPTMSPRRSPNRRRGTSKRLAFSKQASLENIDETASPSKSPSKNKTNMLALSLNPYKSPSPSRGTNLNSTESLTKAGSSPGGNNEDFLMSPETKMKRMKSQFQASMEEKYMKDRMVKKMALLKEFEVSDEKKEELRMVIPTVEAMQKSIQILGLTSGGEGSPDTVIQNTLAGLEAIKAVVEKNIDDGSPTKAGVKPVARDGHSATRVGNKLFILAGDRHKMSFNDLFALNLEYFDAIKS